MGSRALRAYSFVGAVPGIIIAGALRGERMLTEKDSAYVLLLGLGLWIVDRAVQELRRLREELAQIRVALQQQHLLSATRRGLGAPGTDAVKRPIPGVCYHHPPVRVLGARPAQQPNAPAQGRRRGGGRAPSGAPRAA